MKIRLLTYSKYLKSTAQPPWTAGAYEERDFVFKNDTSVNNPVLILTNANNRIFQYNYCYIVELNMYYYIVDKKYLTNSNIEITCKCDALATAKAYILASSGFVAYSASNYNQYLTDDRIQPTSELETLVTNNSFVSEFNEHPEYTSSYSLLLTVLNGEPDGTLSNHSAGIKHYLINSNNLRYLCEKLVEDGDSVIGGIKQIFADAKDSLLKLQLVPWSVEALQRTNLIGSSTTPIYLGNYDTGQAGYMMDANACYDSTDFVDIPTRPDDFTRIEPYCEAKIHIPLIGTYDLSLSELADTDRLYFRYIANIASGKATCILWKGNANINNSAVKIIGSYDGNINADVPLGYATSENPVGALLGGASLAVAALGTGIGTLGGIAGAVSSFKSYFTKQASVINAFGGNASAKDNLKLAIYVFKRGLSETPDVLRQLYGRPCAKVLTIGTLQGYVKTQDFKLQAPISRELIEEVESLMDSGVFIQ